MGITVHPFKRFKSWHLGALAAIGVVVGLSIYAGLFLLGSSQPVGEPVTRRVTLTENQAQRREVPIKGRLAFPNRVELSFGTKGEVGQILVVEGEMVEQGQVLARLDDLTLTDLEENLAQTRLDLDQAQDALERAREEFLTTPLERAKFETEIAQARRSSEDAEEKLADFQRDYRQDLAGARKAKADSEVALDDALEKLADFQRSANKNLADALKTKVDADLAMDQAVEGLGFYQRDQDQDLADARKKRSDAEDKLDQAREALDDFEGDYAATLADSRLDVADAETALNMAKDTLTDYITGLGTVRSFGEDEVEELRRLQTAVREADTDLVQANTELVDLEGDRSLRLQVRQVAVAAAQADLLKTQDGVIELEDETDQLLELQLRQAAAVLAQANLDQAEKDLEEELVGPDPLILAKLEAAAEAIRTKLVQAEFDLFREMAGPDMAELALRRKEAAKRREELGDLIDGPDPFDVAVKEAAVASAQAKMDDASEDLAGAAVRAPFDGIIRLVNVEIDDQVNDESRVIEMVDPRRLEVDGLVDATDITLVKESAQAKVRISTLEDREFAGVVTRVSGQPTSATWARIPRTERGVVSYSITIRVEIPEAVQIPLELGAVSTVVIYEPDEVS